MNFCNPYLKIFLSIILLASVRALDSNAQVPSSCVPNITDPFIDLDNDTYPKCTSNILPIDFPLLGKNGCACNQVPDDCNDSDPRIWSDDVFNTAKAVYNISRITPYIGPPATPPLDPREATINPFQPLKIEIKTHKCITKIEAEVFLQIGSSERFSLGLHKFLSTKELGILDAIIGGRRDVDEPYFQGWFSANSNLGQFLLKIAANKSSPVYIVIGEQRFQIPVDLCVPVSGFGPHRVVLSRPRQMADVNPDGWAGHPVEMAKLVRGFIFGQTSPFYENLERFSFYADLSPLTEINEDEDEYTDGPDLFTGTRACKAHTRIFELVLPSNNELDDVTGQANILKGVVYMASRHLVYIKDNYFSAITHELGHAIGGLADEYTLYPDHKYFLKFPKRNCALAEDISKQFPPPGNVLSKERRGCTFYSALYRSTLNSIMKDDQFYPQFNVISCAWILSELYGQSKDYFIERCTNANTIKE